MTASELSSEFNIRDERYSLEDCECGDVVGEDAEAAGEGGDVDLLDVGVRVVHRVRRGEGERHLGHAALLLRDERGGRY